MVAVTCRSIDDDEMLVDQFGIRTPKNGQMWPYEDIDLIVVPALAFDRQGNRLGRGGGFYDRFLAEPRVHAVTVGLGFAEQLVEELPTHHYDRPVDMLVTDQHVLRFNTVGS